MSDEESKPLKARIAEKCLDKSGKDFSECIIKEKTKELTGD